MAPAAVSSTPNVRVGARRRWVQLPGLKMRRPSGPERSSGRWEWPNTTRSAGGEPAAQTGGAALGGAAVVDHGHPHPAKVELQALREVIEFSVVVAQHGVHARQLAQFSHQVRAGDVAGVQNQVGGGRGVEHPPVQPAARSVGDVGVGQDDDLHAPSVCAGTAGP